MSSTPSLAFSPHIRQFAIQAAAAILVLSLAWPYYGWQVQAIPWAVTCYSIGCVAFGLAFLSRQPWWWRMIHLLFMPAIWSTLQLQIDPAWFLAAFVGMLLIYRGALSGQVPLYFSNRATVSALSELVEQRLGDAGGALADLGAGIGSTLITLSDRMPQVTCTGVENAPLTWLVGRVLAMGRPNLAWRWEDLWQVELADYDIVYVFLSPAPMARLWDKAQREMLPGSLLISNSFPIPGLTPDGIIEVDCLPPRPLYCYEIREKEGV